METSVTLGEETRTGPSGFKARNRLLTNRALAIYHRFRVRCTHRALCIILWLMTKEYMLDGSKITSLEAFYNQVSERLISGTHGAETRCL